MSSNNRRYKGNYKRKLKMSGLRTVLVGVAVLTALVLVVVLFRVTFFKTEEKRVTTLPTIGIFERIIKKNQYSRPGTKLEKVKGIVIHYTANPGTDAMANRNYFDNLPSINDKKENKTYASSHFVVGMDGEIIQCVPTDEIAYASNDRNTDTISIECCHRKKNGRFTQETYQSLLELTVYLCIRYELDAEDVIRHYDVTGKNCPKYFVENPKEWERFRAEVDERLRPAD